MNRIFEGNIGVSFTSIYAGFNYTEGVAWFLIAIILPFWFRKGLPEKRKILFRASFILMLFGISDFFEASVEGGIPAWLWIWKIACATALLKCRYDYLGKENFRWFDRTHILAFACLVAVPLAVLGQIYLREYLSDF